MFRFKSLDVITLFHKPSLSASVRVRNILKQASATATEHATEDQASDHTDQSHPDRQPFELNVTEDPPTPDQLKSILEYVGAQKASSIIKGAKDEADAMRKLKENVDNFQRPIVSKYDVTEAEIVDWNNGRAIIGDNESEILKLLSTLPKQ